MHCKRHSNALAPSGTEMEPRGNGANDQPRAKIIFWFSVSFSSLPGFAACCNVIVVSSDVPKLKLCNTGFLRYANHIEPLEKMITFSPAWSTIRFHVAHNLIWSWNLLVCVIARIDRGLCSCQMGHALTLFLCETPCNASTCDGDRRWDRHRAYSSVRKAIRFRSYEQANHFKIENFELIDIEFTVFRRFINYIVVFQMAGLFLFKQIDHSSIPTRRFILLWRITYIVLIVESAISVLWRIQMVSWLMVFFPPTVLFSGKKTTN